MVYLSLLVIGLEEQAKHCEAHAAHKAKKEKHHHACLEETRNITQGKISRRNYRQREEVKVRAMVECMSSTIVRDDASTLTNEGHSNVPSPRRLSRV